MCERKAVICYDLGEFARFYALGRDFLTSKGAKTCLSYIMANKAVTAELKKEAITAYQKVLMKSWGQ
jgi:hypothetical protein